MRHLVNGVVAVLSIGSFLLALYLAYQEKVAAAGVCIAAAILPVLFNQLPFVEYLKVLGLEAKLRERVNEADAIIAKLKRIASVSAEQLFTQAALVGRWGGEALSSKQERAAQLTSLLQGLEIAPDEITATKTIFLRAIAHDLAHIFFSVIRNLMGAKKRALERERDSLFGKNPVDMRDPKGARWNELLAEERRIDTQVIWPKDVFGSADVDDLKAFCVTFIDRADVLMDDERSTLVAIANELDSLFRACREAGNYTPEAIRYLETYGASASYLNNQNLRFAEAFPEAAKTSG
ncbi:MAG: hypothetical protein AB7F74_00305 [Parvibaculaceae bacterium]